MYFPYLHGRGAELEALVEVADDLGSPQRIVPVVEPAARPGIQLLPYAAKFERTLQALGAHHCSAYVVVNPHQGAFGDPLQVASWSAALSATLADPKLVRPTFKIRSTTPVAELQAFIATHPQRDLGIVVAQPVAMPVASVAAAVASAASGTAVRFFLFPGVAEAPYVASFGASAVVTVHDNFPVKDRNADYSGVSPFGSNHLAFPATTPGGFSDFTVLSPTLTFSGGPTGAAVIHVTFPDPATGAFWVEHFVSTDQIVTSNFQSKLLEAINDLDAAVLANPGKYPASPALAHYHQQAVTGQVTSQGRNKRLHIIHHLYTVARHLNI